MISKNIVPITLTKGLNYELFQVGVSSNSQFMFLAALCILEISRYTTFFDWVCFSKQVKVSFTIDLKTF